MKCPFANCQPCQCGHGGCGGGFHLIWFNCQYFKTMLYIFWFWEIKVNYKTKRGLPQDPNMPL